MEGYGRYVLVKLSTDESAPLIAGIGAKGPRMPVAAWGIYVRVANMEASRARVEELGGQNHTGIMTVPGTGRMSVVTDPTGAFFSILEPEAM
jgi:predicted enzyme related to lactoylglutathione lyase